MGSALCIIGTLFVKTPLRRPRHQKYWISPTEWVLNPFMHSECVGTLWNSFSIHFRFDIIDIIASIPNKQKETQREDINEGQKGEEYWNIELPRSVYTDSTSRYLVDREHCNSCKHKSRLRRGSGVIGFVGSIKGRSWKVNRICMVYTKYCMEYGEWMTMRHL